ncbi:mitochondrial assembly of ribosomal large subunit protein 1 isoform X2 [Hyla sarda]|uniref:mitochondrial assembly of ribosomal large subunit protein 1 isoform X2 n=1 Tax=Hyla sarda TaxID=327740 RepID=UPI0024C2A62C|nr:mitochondrial assembly of ribosomal large subunit protein 1 isoform X2 [Hyla sarda]
MLCPSGPICRHHAGVSAGWVTGPGALQLPGVRTCLLQSHRPYSAYIRNTESMYNADPDVEDGPERGSDEALQEFNINVLYKFLKGESDPHVHLEGKDTDDWMCIDFGNIVVHFMLPETRETYELEKLWTLRSHDDQLSEMADEVLPLDFTFGLQQPKD